MSSRGERLYRALLRLYPASLRARFSADMVDLFLVRRAAARGPVAVARLWWRLLGDVAGSWRRRDRGQPPAERARRAAWLSGDEWRQSWRGLRRRPLLSVTAVLVLGVGLAASISALSIVKTLLQSPYPYPGLDRLVLIRDGRPAEGAHQSRAVSSADIAILARESRTLEATAQWRVLPVVIGDTAGDATPQAYEGQAVSANFFDVLGVQAVVGRTFSPLEDTAGSDDRIVISHRLWQSRFAADPKAINSSILVNSRPMTIIGVIADAACYDSGADAWVPLVLSPSDTANHEVQRAHALARLAPRATLAAARQDADRVAARLAEEFPATNRGRHFDLIELRAAQYEFTAPLFLLVQACALLVLVLAAVNVAGLLTARASDRAREFAVRLALGASRRRIFGLLVAESLGLGVIAGALGLAAASAVMAPIRGLLPEGIARWIAGWSSIRVDLPVAAGGVALTLATALCLGCATGWQAMQPRGRMPLADAGRAIAPRRTRTRRAIVVAQVALAMALLMCGSVVAQGFSRLAGMFDGVGPPHVVVFRVTRPGSEAPAKLVAFQRALMDQVAGIRGVAGAGFIQNHPASNVPCPVVTLDVDGRPVPPQNERARVDLQTISAGTLPALRVGLLRGRLLDDGDRAGTERVAVISESLASRFWPNADPTGARVRLGGDAAPWTTVVGVVSDLRLNWYDEDARPTVYVPFAQAPSADLYVVARTTTDPEPLAAAAREVVHHLDPRQPMGAPRILQSEVDDSMAPLRALSLLLSGAGIVAMVLAATGMYGAIAQAVTLRLREFGLRVALGASPAGVQRLMLADALRVTAAGVLLGLPIAVAALRVIRAQLFGVTAPGAPEVAATAALLSVSALVAAWIPSSRARRADPTALLRTE